MTATSISEPEPRAPTPQPPGVAVTSPRSRRRQHVAFSAATVLVALAAIFQNFFRLDRAPVSADEPLYAEMGWRYVHWSSLSAAEVGLDVPGVLHNFEHPPLAKLLFGVAQLIVGHPSITAARAVAAACTIGGAIVLAIWLGRAANRWIGLLAGALLALIPMAVHPAESRFGRSAMLDPVAQLFMVCALALAWFWFRHRGWRGWLFALAAGMATGLATASKINGFLGVLVPIGLGLIWARKEGLLGRLAQLTAGGLLAVAVFLTTYLPFNEPFARIVYIFAFQRQHRAQGHLIGLAGLVTSDPPWWAVLWYAGEGIGPLLSVVLPLTALAAVVLRRDRLIAWLAAALLIPFVFHAFVAGVVLSFYWALWMPAVVALAAIGVGELVRAARRSGYPAIRVAAATGAAAALAGMLIPAVAEANRVAHLDFVGGGAVAAIRSDHGLTGEILMSGTYTAELTPYLGGTKIHPTVPTDLANIDTVLVGQPRCRIVQEPAVLAVVTANLAEGTLRLEHSDRLLRVYVAVGELRAPSSAEVAAESAGELADYC